MIPDEFYRKIISVLPIVCVDVIVQNECGKYLLFKRNNEPLAGHWWVLGGRIAIGESARAACTRILQAEAAISVDQFTYNGFYEDVFDRNAFDVPQPYHTVSLVFSTAMSADQEISLDQQHSEHDWFDELPTRFVTKTQIGITRRRENEFFKE